MANKHVMLTVLTKGDRFTLPSPRYDLPHEAHPGMFCRKYSIFCRLDLSYSINSVLYLDITHRVIHHCDLSVFYILYSRVALVGCFFRS